MSDTDAMLERILSAEKVARQRWLCEANGYDEVVKLADSHEALRDLLAAVEAARVEAVEQARLTGIDWMNELDARNAAEARAEQAERDLSLANEQADRYLDEKKAALVRVADLTASLRDLIAHLDRCTSTARVTQFCRESGALAAARAALGEQEAQEWTDGR